MARSFLLAISLYRIAVCPYCAQDSVPGVQVKREISTVSEKVNE